MSDNAFVTPMWRSLSTAMDSRSQDRTQVDPQQIPVNVVAVDQSIVTVEAQMKGNYTLPKVKIAQAYSDWHRLPTAAGDKGVMRATDFYIGGQTGLGGGTADYYDRANLATMVYHAVSQKKFPHIPVWDNTAHLIHGQNGAVIRDTAGNCIVTLTGNKITIAVNSGVNIYIGKDPSKGTPSPILTVAGPLPNVFGVM